MLNRQFINYFFKGFFISFLLFMILSCNKNDIPIIPPEEPSILDSNFFDWQIDTIQTSPGYDMFMADTNTLYIPGVPYFYCYSNGSSRYINYNDNDFTAWCVNGTDNNNIFIGGDSRSKYQSRLKRWNGASIEEIVMPSDSANQISRIEVISNNDIWLSTLRNIIYHYSNNSFETFVLDTGLTWGRVYKDNNNNLFVCIGRNLGGVYPNFISYIFKFENNSWLQIWSDTVSSSSEFRGFSGFTDNQILYSGKSGMYYFSNNSIIKFINFNLEMNIYLSTGKNLNNVLFDGREENSGHEALNFYDGNKIYRQPTKYLPTMSFASLQHKYDRYYFSLYGDYEHYFGILKLKNKLVKKSK